MAIHLGFLATEAENGFHHVGTQVTEVSVTVPLRLKTSTIILNYYGSVTLPHHHDH